jgi:methyltransferase-like protein/SAM-dependent methyltransferase
MVDSYDELPYRSVPHPDSHPSHLAVLGRLFGLPAADPGACRVLELGCASGGNLIPVAWYHTACECVGVERSDRQAADGRRLVADLGLRNVRILTADILSLGPELGRFDYVIAHGVYSWVPAPVREQILALCREVLAPNGIAYVSFNTMPGWGMRGALREMLLFHCRGVEGRGERLARARDLLALLDSSLATGGTPAQRNLLDDVRYLLEAHPSYLYHEYLADTNEPTLFSDFAANVARHGLQYLGDAELGSMIPALLGEAAEQALSCFDDQVELEQYIDFVRVRSFRKALLCHAEPPLSREIDLAAVEALAFYADLTPPEALDLAGSEPAVFTLASGGTAAAAQPLTRAALQVLAERFPDSLAFADLLQVARSRVLAAGGAVLGANALAADLFSLLAGKAVRAEPTPRHHPIEAPATPRANTLVRTQAAAGHVATPRHQALDVDAFACHLLALLDGSRDVPAVEAQVLADVRSGRLAALLPHASANAVREGVARLLRTFRRHGVLAPDPVRQGLTPVDGSASCP